MKKIFLKSHIFMLVAVLITGCVSSAIFNQKAYEQATSLKVDALTLMDQATEPFADHRKAVDELTIKIEKAYQYCLGLPNNEETIGQWEIIKDPDRNSLMGFLKRWETEKQLSQTFINNVKDLVSKGFDEVIELESKKVGK